jgi:hypothetical protein
MQGGPAAAVQMYVVLRAEWLVQGSLSLAAKARLVVAQQ